MVGLQYTALLFSSTKGALLCVCVCKVRSCLLPPPPKKSKKKAELGRQYEREKGERVPNQHRLREFSDGLIALRVFFLHETDLDYGPMANYH